jgi:hypothetical protein
VSLPPSFLRDRLEVKALDDDLVAVTITLPAELVKDYCRFLDSLASFFSTVKNKSTIAQAHAKAAFRALDQKAEETLAAYRTRVVSAFDRHTAQGLGRKDAIKAIAAELRAENHPWRSPDLVRATLVEAGRSGRPGRPRRGES